MPATDPAIAPPPRWFRRRSAMAFSAPMIVNGIALPFYPVWLQSLDFDKAAIGTILAVPLIVRVIAAPAISYVADQMPERANVLIWSGILSLMTAIALFFTDHYWPVLLIFAIQGAVYAPYVPIAEALLITGVRRWGYDYGFLRLWGSAAFIVSTLIGGHIIGLSGGSAVLPLLVFGFVLTVLMGFGAPRVGRLSAPVRRVVAESGRKARTALSRRDLQLVMIGSSLVQGSHALLYTFSTIYWEGLGYSGTAIGMLWSAGVLAEIVAFFYAKQLNRMFGAWTLIRIGCTVAVCRWILFPMEMGYAGYFALQCLHAFTYAFCHIGIQRRIVETVKEDQEASAQGNYFFYNGVFMAVVTFASGYLYRQMGLTSFYVMSLVALIGLGCVMSAWYLQPKPVAENR